MIGALCSVVETSLYPAIFSVRLARRAARCARPGRRRHRPGQRESTQALSDDEVRELLRVVKRRADSGDLVGKRDYAMLLFYLLTGMRRTEIASLHWGDVKRSDTLTITAKVKSDEYQSREVADPKNAATTRVYLRRVAVKRDKHNARIAERLEV